MTAPANPFDTLDTFASGASGKHFFHSLPRLEEAGLGKISRLPVSIRVVLESVLRNCDGKRISEDDVKRLAAWNPTRPGDAEIPFVVARIVLQDFTGVPLLVDLAAMRSAVQRLKKDPSVIEPLVPVDLVVDHSVQVDRSGTPAAFEANLKIEFERNRERYEFLKWGQQAFDTFKVVPPAVGIVHQVNLEYLARVVDSQEIEGGRLFFPDSLVGTDSHTTMINGLGVVGWGVGGIEAEAGMLGQPVYFLTPEVVGVNLSGRLTEGVTATDLTLRLTQLLREAKVVGKFVEFFGEGARRLTVADRATIANMAPEYGATMGFFPVDEATLDYLRSTGRTEEAITGVRNYYTAQGMFGIPAAGEIDFSQVLELDLGTVVPSVSGPKRPQDRIDLPELKRRFHELYTAPAEEGGFGKSAESLDAAVPVDLRRGALLADEGSGAQDTEEAAPETWGEVEMVNNRPTDPENRATTTLDEPARATITNGSVLIAAITSCTNTSNPSVMLAAGLLAKKAVERGLRVSPLIKTSLAPGSRVVTDYLRETGLQEYLDQLGFNLVGYGCTTCIGNSGPLYEPVEKAIEEGDLIAASVLSGNRNFEARIHSAIKANFLMSPPLVVAFALAGRVDIDLLNEPLAEDPEGKPVFLRDLWPSNQEVQDAVNRGLNPAMFRRQYANVIEANPEWTAIKSATGSIYDWDADSTYIQEPPFFEDFSLDPEPIRPVKHMRPLAILGESVTTDHISPAGAIGKDTPAGRYLMGKGVEVRAFNSYGSRRGNDRIMTRGTFANVRIKNRLADGREGGFTKLMPEDKILPIYDACEEYRRRGEPLVVFAGADYGMGSSRDWAAKGTRLLGVRAVVATSFERIHRSNLVGLGVLPLQFPEGESAESLGLDGSETFSLPDLGDDLRPGHSLDLVITRADGSSSRITLKARIDTPIEVEYYRHGGILPFVLRELLKSSD
ncbi:MAG: aconitate hydratase [Puniceicoccaceae bacterium]|nr:MAG: aconitate hydratase [Puniceicoccaceae bacterium]